MPTTESRDFTTFANVARSGSSLNNWLNASNAASDNNLYATCEADLLASGGYSPYLRGVDITGAALPSGRSVTQIVLSIRRYNQEGISWDIQDSQVSLVRAGTVQATNKANTSSNWPGSEALATYTFAASDLSGWTTDDLNSATFGAVLSIKATGLGEPPISDGARVDYMAIQYTYSDAATTNVTINAVTHAASALTYPASISVSDAISATTSTASAITYPATISISQVGEGTGLIPYAGVPPGVLFGYYIESENTLFCLSPLGGLSGGLFLKLGSTHWRPL